MACAKGQKIVAARELIDGLFASGKTSQAVFHRFSVCCHASECGRLCRWLVKGPGVRAFCVGPDGGQKRDLYTALAEPDFHCSDGRF